MNGGEPKFLFRVASYYINYAFDVLAVTDTLKEECLIYRSNFALEVL